MNELAVEFSFTLPIGEIPAQHRDAAERKAREAFILSLLKQGDLSAGRTAELLGVDRWRLSELMSAYAISPFDETLTGAGLEREVNDAFDDFR